MSRQTNFVESQARWGSDPARERRRDLIRWRLNRVRCMSPAEVLHRVARSVSMQVERAGLRSDAVPAPAFGEAAQPWVRADARVDAARYLEAADRIAAGKLDLFALRDFDFGSPPRWNRDPKTGVEARLTFGKLLDYRNPKLVGDIKYVWELNRHAHLVTLAQAYALSRERRYFDVVRTQLESWFEACPPGLGPNWVSSLELGLRLISWSVVWQLVGGARAEVFADAAGEAFRTRWLQCIYRHARFIRHHFSRYSSANNHLIGEAAGLFIAALTWPHWPEAAAWREEAAAILEREALLQNAPDGVNREQAVSYQQFGVDLLLLPLLAARASKKRLSVDYEARVEAMLEYLASIMDAGGHVPQFGDSDDGLVLKLAVDPQFCRYRSSLASGALLYRRAAFKLKAGALDDKSRWLFGEGADASYEALPLPRTRAPVRRQFRWGGYHVLGTDFETAREVRLVADAGPLGYQSIAAHGHADALSFTLSLGGLEFLIDPGTYAYHTHGAWRQYFRGTGAHSTIRIDGLDQSESGGHFMWIRKANAECSLWASSEGEDVFEGWHDGYRRLADPVTHRRRITFDKAARRFVIVDTLEMAKEHAVELLFHCSDQCQVAPVAGGYRLTQQAQSLVLRLPQLRTAGASVCTGRVTPMCGWMSTRFDEKRPSPTIVWKARITGTCALRTQINC